MERTSIYESPAIFLCPPQPGQGRYPIVIKELEKVQSQTCSNCIYSYGKRASMWERISSYHCPLVAMKVGEGAEPEHF
jgi:hypothetical protein